MRASMFLFAFVAFTARAQPATRLYDAARGAGATPAAAAGLSAAMRAGAPVQEARLRASAGVSGDRFAHAVAIDGDRALVGTLAADGSGDANGAASVFVRSGTEWTLEARLRADDAVSGMQFGESVALSGDRVLVGAPYGFQAETERGTAYVFARSGSTWTQEARLLAADGQSQDAFGFSVALDGARALVGADRDREGTRVHGSAYVFARDGTACAQEAKLLAADGQSNDAFGFSVALDGARALIGARGDDDIGFEAGSAYVFAQTGTAWTQDAKLTASDGGSNDQFGASVALSGGRALIGAAGVSSVTTAMGAAYVFSGVAPVADEPGASAGGLALAAAPNPARSASAVTLALGEPQSASVRVYDALGREVARLHDGPLSAGTHTFRLDAEALPAGVYVVRATAAAGAGTEARTRRIVVVR